MLMIVSSLLRAFLQFLTIREVHCEYSIAFSLLVNITLQLDYEHSKQVF